MTRMTWKELTEGLNDHEALWQDLDGVHLEALPMKPPHTSILWAWPREISDGPADASELRRIRLDAPTGTTWVATPGEVSRRQLLPWGEMHEVDQLRTAGDLTPQAVRMLRLVEYVEVPTAGGVPVMFYGRR